MNGFPFLDSPIFTWGVVPALIVLARVVDVTLDTIRIIYIARGLKYLAPVFGFFEILIWLIAISQIMRNLDNPVYYLAYAVGFATGNLVGIFVEERLAMGRVMLRVITQKDSSGLVAHLRSCGYGVTTVDAAGSTGPVKLIFTVIDRYKIGQVVQSIQTFNPKAFYSVEDVRVAREGTFPPSRRLRDLFRLKG